VIDESPPTAIEQSPLHLELAAWEREARAHGVDPTPRAERVRQARSSGNLGKTGKMLTE
jgi:hypothetical protein